jgi:hypothetical protein
MIASMSARAKPASDRTPLGIWGEHAGRRRRLARADVAIGLALAALALLLAPGIALVGIGALLVLAVCLGSMLLTRRVRARRHR